MTRTRTRLAALFTTLLMLVGIGGLAAAVPASAHTGDLNATAVCQDDGTYLVTYKLTVSNTSLTGSTMWRIGDTSFDGTPTSNNGMDRGPVATHGAGTYVLGTQVIPGNRTKANWAYAYTTWTDGYKKGSDGGDISLSGNCKPKDTPVTTQAPTSQDETCKAGGSITIPAVTGVQYKIDGTNKGAGTYTASAGNHTVTAAAKSGYVLTQGSTTSWQMTIAAKGDCTTHVTPAAPTYTPGTCTVNGSVNALNTDAYSWTVTGPQNARKYTAVAKAGYTLDGQTIWTFDLTKTNYLDAACQPKFEVETACGYVKITFVNNSQWDLYPDYRLNDEPSSGNYGSGPVYNVVKVASGTTKVIYEHTFDENALPDPQVVSYQSILGPERDIDIASQPVDVETNCIPNVTPVSPTITQPVCTGPGTSTPGSFTVPQTKGITYTTEGNVVTATADKGYEIVSAPQGWTRNDSEVPSWSYTVVYDQIDCTVDVTPVAPTIDQSVCTGPGTASAPVVHLPSTEGIDYSYTEGDTWVTATPQEGYRLDVSETDWNLLEDGSATLKIQFIDPGDCLVEVTPVIPTVEQSVCTGPGQSSDPEVVLASTEGIEYALSEDGNTVTAAPQQGYYLAESAGWTLGEDGTATFAVIYTRPGPCLVKVTATAPTFTEPTCDTPLGAKVNLPEAPEGVEYGLVGDAAAGHTVTVTATAAPGYTLVGPVSWSHTFAVPDDCTTSLPHTGASDVGFLALVGLAGIAAGVVAMVAARRRGQH